MQQIKVVGVGFHKTGISTLGKCLQIMGYNHISLDYNSFLLYKSGNFEALKTIVENYDSFDAWPWPLLYKEIDNWFPDTKFVLTRRLNSEVWFSSLSRHVSRKKKLNKKKYSYRKYIYGYDDPEENKSHHINVYETHNQNLREYFKEKPDQFLEVCWEEKNGWENLCSFLGKDVPKEPFPHKNMDTNLKFRTNILKRMASKTFGSN